MDKSLLEVEALLRDYIPLVSIYGADGKSVQRMEVLLKLAGNPHKNLKVIHIAGTSGKTSTAYFLSAMLVSTGKKVGLTVSPHIYSIAERIQINNENMSSDEFLNELKLFLELLRKSPVKPSYFELMLAFALWEFKRQDVDYAVIETGMGGLLDASNVINNRDKVCVITDIGFDHMHVLGNTLKEIATQKAGIIHESNTVFMYRQSPDIMEAIIDRVKSRNAELNLINEDSNKIATLSQLPEFQIRNYILSSKVYEYLSKRDLLNIKHTINPSQVKIPGRMEILKLSNGSTLVLDGAHNEQKMKSMVNSFKKLFPDKKAIVILALKEGKDYKDVIDKLKFISEEIIITTFDSSVNLPSKSQDPNAIKTYCESINIDSSVIKSNKQAVLKALEYKEKIILVTGSFYLISQTRSLF